MSRAGIDVVDEAVVECLGSGEPVVPLGVLDDLLDALAGVLGIDLGHLTLGVLEELRIDGDLGGSAAHTAQRLVHEDLGVWQGVTLALRASGEQELPHGGSHTPWQR